MIPTVNRVALITGGSSDIGKKIVQKFLDNNVKVIAQFNSTEIDIESENLKTIKCSFNKKKDLEDFVQTVFECESSIDFLINATGIIENRNFLECSMEVINEVFQVNFFSHAYLMKTFFPIMVRNKFGRIVSLSSIGLKFGGSMNSAYYSASKSALEAITRSYAKFGAQSNVLCNTIRVGVIDTKIHKNKDMVERSKMIPVNRLGRPEEIAEMVFFLCSDKSDFITGQEFAVSGGE